MREPVSLCKAVVSVSVGLQHFPHLEVVPVKKKGQKNTYPPLADGLCVRFLCKSDSSANIAAAHAGCGASQAIRHSTVCKVLTGIAKGLHSGRWCAVSDPDHEPLGLPGAKNKKMVLSVLFQNPDQLIPAAYRAVAGRGTISRNVMFGAGSGGFDGRAILHSVAGHLADFRVFRPVFEKAEKVMACCHTRLRTGEKVISGMRERERAVFLAGRDFEQLPEKVI
ncbi:hypothetical protein [Pseudomonas sp. RC10]|uniref:hypothetical protein n=1 Tax=Pseudomonas bambusae TaxID=3139142 RepID=UPI00313A4477